MEIKEATLLEGKVIAAEVQAGIKEAVEGFVSKNRARPCLMAIQVGEDPSAKWYLGQQQKLASKLGIDFEQVLPEKVQNQEELHWGIEEANGSTGIHGIFITMPLPKGFDPDAALLRLDPRKDVEGIHPTSLGLIVLRRAKLIPSTAFAAFRLIESTGIELWGKKATLIGQSAITGRPLQLLLGEKRVTTTVCNTGTSVEEVEKAVSASDIVVACAGKPGMVKGEWIKPGAIVIDIGTTEVDGKLVGDVQFEEAKKRAGYITPVPGGVGPLTVTMLMQNLVNAYKWQKGIG